MTTHSGVFDQILHSFTTGACNWTTASRIWTQLQTNTAPTKTWTLYSDITNQWTGGTAYSAGGITCTPGTSTIASNVCNLDAPDAVWSGATFGPVYYAITVWGTPIATAGNFCCSYHDLGGAQSVVAGTFTCQWSSSPVAVFNITSAADA